MIKQWIVTFRFNGFVHSKRFINFFEAQKYYHLQQENGYDPSIHEE